MTKRRATYAILVTLALSACTCEDIDPMRRQPKFKAYQANPLFADGRAMRTPPEGTVSREHVRGSIELIEGGTDAKPATTFPMPVTTDLLNLGRGRFEIYCATCHGILGDGDSVVARNMSLRPPPNLTAAPYSERSVGSYYRTITYGFGLMAPYSGELSVKERWAVVAYLKALQRSQAGKLEDVPADQRAALDHPPAAKEQR